MVVNFVFTEEQEELRRVVRSFLHDVAPLSSVRRLMESPEDHDPAVWGLMAAQLGLQGLHICERFGGLGLSWLELALVFEEMGAALLCAPFFSTVALAATAVLASGDDRACADLLPGIASGETLATLAVAEDGGRWDEESVALAASQAPGGGWSLDGHKSYVTDGLAAGLVLVAARTATGTALFAVDGEAAGLAREALAVMDLTRPLARLSFRSTPARLVGPDGGAWPFIERALALAAIALSAEAVGGAQHCLDMSVAHAKARVQFGRPIGSFQAVKHRLADSLVELEAARSAVYYAAGTADDPEAGTELGVAASMAKLASSEAYLGAAAGAIQVHGALGFTWEHDAHLFFKRAKSSALLLGEAAHHRLLLANQLGL